MKVRIAVLGSGSRGNAVVFESGGSAIMVDAGFGLRTLASRLAAARVRPESIELVVLTHDHLDHIRGARRASARWGWPIVATPGTLEVGGLDGEVRSLRAGALIQTGELLVRCFRVPHDAAEPVAVLVESRRSGIRAGLVYDLGETTAALAHRFAGLDVLLLEANHDTTMLWAGWYPAAVKRRIAGRLGHLSNYQAAHFAAEVAHRGLQRVVLCHLSQNNNTPRRAWVAVNDALKRTTFRGSVGLAQQDSVAVVQVGSRSTAKQLELAI